MLRCNSELTTASAASKKSPMIPHANTARWRPAVKPLWVARALKGLIGVLAFGIAAQYLAGYLFLYWIHRDPKTATPLTVARYAYYYGARQVSHTKRILRPQSSNAPL